MKKLWADRKNFFLLICTAAFAASVLLLFGPIQLYLSNISELWFSLGTVVVPSLIAFILATAALTGIGFLFFNVKKLLCGYAALLCGLGLALYVQGNFIPFNYGILNGETVDWAAYGNEAKLSILVWAICLIVPFLVCIIFPKQCKEVLISASCGIFMVQLVALFGLGLTTDFSQSEVSEMYISDKGLYEVSDEQNVVVFIFDTFDAEFLEEVYSADASYLDFMDGFTYFTDATSAYPNTRGSMPYLLTGQYYENDMPYNEYITKAWEDGKDYYLKLQEMEFEIGIYTTMNNIISDEAKDSLLCNAVKEKLMVSSYTAFEKELLCFTAMRFFPDFAKKYIWTYDTQFEKLKTSTSETISPFVWEETIFYQRLMDEGLSITPGKKYHFIHLDGTHPPYTILEDLSENQYEADQFTEAKAVLNVVREYIRQLKQLNIYDQTCIVITADHGRIRCTPSLLVKQFHAEGEVQLDSTPVSHSSLRATVMEELGYNGFGQSVFRDKESLSTSRRCFMYEMDGKTEWGKAYFPDMIECYTVLDSNNEKWFIPTGRIFSPSGVNDFEPFKYSIGETLTFDNRDKVKSSYFMFEGHGATSDEEYLWSLGHHGIAYFQIDELYNDLICHMRLYNWVPTDSQHVIVRSNGITLYDNTVTSDMPYINFALPQSYVKGGTISLDFEFPDACSPASIGVNDEDDRILSIAFRELVFEEQKETQTIQFAADGNARDYLYSGWHSLGEYDASWTNEEASLLAVLPSEEDQEMRICYHTNPAATDTDVYYNGEYIGTLPHHEGRTEEAIVLPAKFKSDSDAQTISFVTNNAATYNGTAGNGDDFRIVGIQVSEIDFTSVP